eukprot:scaffold21381_cov40-Phaeocystis_antarctica.AAC.1
MACARRVHGVCMARTLYAHRMHAACTPHARCVCRRVHPDRLLRQHGVRRTGAHGGAARADPVRAARAQHPRRQAARDALPDRLGGQLGGSGGDGGGDDRDAGDGGRHRAERLLRFDAQRDGHADGRRVDGRRGPDGYGGVSAASRGAGAYASMRMLPRGMLPPGASSLIRGGPLVFP